MTAKQRLIMLRAATAALLLAAGVTPAISKPYWIAWEGDDFPENQGWTRCTGAGGVSA